MNALAPRLHADQKALIIPGTCGLYISCDTKPAQYNELSSSAQLRVTGADADKRVAFNTDAHDKNGSLLALHGHHKLEV
ncbi:hypothetical protein [Rhizobium sp. 18055]|uniref:hypothetical protein n=1 Tax=Rhizobium sp. 18055 TaxID=2681403 RepID=UPI00135985F7|nr:hypothetical protein [Rhizobium sp. 18055]